MIIVYVLYEKTKLYIANNILNVYDFYKMLLKFYIHNYIKHNLEITILKL